MVGLRLENLWQNLSFNIHVLEFVLTSAFMYLILRWIASLYHFLLSKVSRVTPCKFITNHFCNASAKLFDMLVKLRKKCFKLISLFLVVKIANFLYLSAMQNFGVVLRKLKYCWFILWMCTNLFILKYCNKYYQCWNHKCSRQRAQ